MTSSMIASKPRRSTGLSLSSTSALSRSGGSSSQHSHDREDYASTTPESPYSADFSLPDVPDAQTPNIVYPRFDLSPPHAQQPNGDRRGSPSAQSFSSQDTNENWRAAFGMPDLGLGVDGVAPPSPDPMLESGSSNGNLSPHTAMSMSGRFRSTSDDRFRKIPPGLQRTAYARSPTSSGKSVIAWASDFLARLATGRDASPLHRGGQWAQYPPSPSFSKPLPSHRRSRAFWRSPRFLLLLVVGSTVFLFWRWSAALSSSPDGDGVWAEAVGGGLLDGLTPEDVALLETLQEQGVDNLLRRTDPLKPPRVGLNDPVRGKKLDTGSKKGGKSSSNNKGKSQKNAKKPAKPPAKPLANGNILGLNTPSRRYVYGANFVSTVPAPETVKEPSAESDEANPAEDDEEASARDKTNKSGNPVPTEAELRQMFEEGRDKYTREEEFWRGFVWQAPEVHDSLTRFARRLNDDELTLRKWIKRIRMAPTPSARGVGLAASAEGSLDPVDDAVPLVMPPNERGGSKGVAVDSVELDEEDEEAELADAIEAAEAAAAAEDQPDRKRHRKRAVPEAGGGRPARLAPLDNSASHAVRKRAREDSGGAAASKAKGKTVPEKAPMDFVGGSLIKWAGLMQEAGEELGGSCAGSTWLEDYRNLHDEMLAGERDPSFISYICEKGMNCGGLGDRLLGMTSAMYFALVTNRAFVAEWQSPIPLDVVFDSPYIDWSYSSFTADAHPVFGNQTLQEEARELDIIHFDRRSMDHTFGTTHWVPKKGKKPTKGMEKRDIAFASPFIKLFTNRGMIYRSFSYQHLQDRVRQLGLKPLNTFSCMLNYLFRPKPAAMGFITDYTSVFSLPTVFSVGIQIRTGDASMKDPEYDKINTVDLHGSFFKCAKQLAETYAMPDQKIVYYLVTDSAHLREDAMRRLRDRVVISGAGIEHIHVKSGHADGVFSAVLEDWILAKTDYRVITQDSGFGKVATFASGQKASTITLFPEANLDVAGLMSKKSHVNVDCRLESAFSTYDELSNEWSLG